MNKQEATESLLNGSKVTHPELFNCDFLYAESGFIFSSTDHKLGDVTCLTTDWFWAKVWNDDKWTIYREN